MTCPSMASSPDGIRLYEDDQGGLFASIVIANDVANLHRYVEDCGPPLFGEPAECEGDYFFMATVNGSTDTLRVLAEIYQSDHRQKEPLRSRLERQNIRLLNLACANAQFKTAEYLMNCGPPLGEMFNERGHNLASRLIADGDDLHGKETWHEIATGSIDNVTATLHPDSFYLLTEQKGEQG